MIELVALKQALAAEQAVVYGYGVVGAHLSGKDRKYAFSQLVAHENLRDRISALITTAGAVAPPSQAAYRLPMPVTGAKSARLLAAQLESGAAGAAWDLCASTAAQSPAREVAVGWLTNAAVAAARWGAPAASIPGRRQAS
ncbi:MAG TPA: ferritin-like domain-containing protein [Mycobacteriales bacterium]|nr:ferritin-like domain-containing protein [Mycobacteriales bacterium]